VANNGLQYYEHDYNRPDIARILTDYEHTGILVARDHRA